MKIERGFDTHIYMHSVWRTFDNESNSTSDELWPLAASWRNHVIKRAFLHKTNQMLKLAWNWFSIPTVGDGVFGSSTLLSFQETFQLEAWESRFWIKDKQESNSSFCSSGAPTGPANLCHILFLLAWAGRIYSARQWKDDSRDKD